MPELQINLNIRGRRVPTRGDYEREWTERQELWEKAETAEANRRAAELLDRFLTPEQKRTWYNTPSPSQWNGKRDAGRYFHLNSHGRQFVITRGFLFNVVELIRGAYRFAYCAGPRNVPLDDFILAQLILLKYDQRAFFRIANVDHCMIAPHRFP